MYIKLSDENIEMIKHLVSHKDTYSELCNELLNGLLSQMTPEFPREGLRKCSIDFNSFFMKIEDVLCMTEKLENKINLDIELLFHLYDQFFKYIEMYKSNNGEDFDRKKELENVYEKITETIKTKGFWSESIKE